jgi:hypothetical protein
VVLAAQYFAWVLDAVGANRVTHADTKSVHSRTISGEPSCHHVGATNSALPHYLFHSCLSNESLGEWPI